MTQGTSLFGEEKCLGGEGISKEEDNFHK